MRYIGDMKKTKFFCIVIILIALIGQSVFSTGIHEGMFPYTLSPQIQATADPITENMEKLELLYRLVERDFLFDIDHQKVFESMAKGLFAGLGDEYSAYIVSEEAADFSEETTGVYGGIGAYISKNYLEYRDFSKPETYMVNITSVFPGSPAEAAGLRAGDLISHIDGNPVDDMEAHEASKALKGEPNTPVVLTVVRGDMVFDVTVIRQIVTVPTVSKTIIEDTIGYLRITQFTNSTGEQVRKELENFLTKGISSLIIDLRDNPGGIVDSALAVADMLLSDTPIVHVISKYPSKNHTYTASQTTLVPSDIPVVVLINGGSASSSEILAGALQDNKRAILIGSTTFGKGLIQIVSPFFDGYYTLTTSQYRTPNGSDIHKIGISPDIEVEELTIAEEDMDAYLKLINSGMLTDFVKAHPGYSEEQVQLFMETVVGPDPPLDPEVYRLLLRREYIYAIPYDERPIVDPEFDNALKRAIEYLKSGK